MVVKKFLSSIEVFIEENELFNKDAQLLVAASGGPDSVAVAVCLIRLGYAIGLAHCNFNLRAQEADKDEYFVRKLAKENNIPFYVQSFDTEKFTKENNGSIQMAARDLRYGWLEQIRIKNDYDFIVVGHHQNDQVETILMNIARGCGLDGLSGMIPKNNFIVRPFLNHTKEQIVGFLEAIDQPFRIDQSNYQSKYKRNSVRLELIPLFEKINPSFSNHLAKLGERMVEVQQFVNHQIEELRTELVKKHKNSVEISIERLLKGSTPSFVLYELIKGYGFKNSDIEGIIASIKGNSGSVFLSKTHRLIKDRLLFIIQPLDAIPADVLIEISSFKVEINSPISLKMETRPSHNFVKNTSIACINPKKVVFPVKLRRWKNGDLFYPIGMRGKKKVSDLLIDLKFSISAKEDVFILENGDGRIIWVVGIRLDDRFRYLNDGKDFWKATIFK